MTAYNFDGSTLDRCFKLYTSQNHVFERENNTTTKLQQNYNIWVHSKLKLDDLLISSVEHTVYLPGENGHLIYSIHLLKLDQYYMNIDNDDTYS